MADDVPGCFEFVDARVDFYQHAVGDDDSVVHQHAQSEDKRTEGNSLERNVVDFHNHERSRYRYQQHHADNHARPQAHENKQHDDDDSDSFDEVDHECVDGFSYSGRLIGNDAQLHADGPLRF